MYVYTSFSSALIKYVNKQIGKINRIFLIYATPTKFLFIGSVSLYYKLNEQYVCTYIHCIFFILSFTKYFNMTVVFVYEK